MIQCVATTDVRLKLKSSQKSRRQKATHDSRDRAHTDDDDAMAHRCFDVGVDTKTSTTSASAIAMCPTARAREHRARVDSEVRGGSETTVRARRGRRAALRDA